MVSKEHITTPPISKAGLEKSLLRPKAALQMDPIRDKRSPLLEELMQMTRCVFGCEFMHNSIISVNNVVFNTTLWEEVILYPIFLCKLQRTHLVTGKYRSIEFT